ncbi:MAG: VIT domain-containing protein [Blastocatellia bacterium]
MTEEPTTVAPASADEKTTTDATPIERLLASPVEMAEPSVPSFAPYINSAKRKEPGYFLFFGGVVLPIIVVLLEVLTGMCAEQFFDPLPTVWHALIVASVPAANLYLWLQLQHDDFEYRRLHGVVNGFVIVVAGAYTIIFAPLLPLAVLALILLGMGILPMAPLFAFIASIFFARHLRRAMRAEQARISPFNEPQPVRLRGLALGIACAVVAFGLAEGHRTITYVGMEMAASSDQQRSLRGIRLLRSFGHERTMLAACESRSREFEPIFGALLSWGPPGEIAAARTIFYRVTGKTHESARTSKGVAAAFVAVTNKLDPDQTGEITPSQGRAEWMTENLALASSQMDGSLDPDAALGYLEWTMVFRNTAGVQQEAVSQIQLPPGGVVSRLTLWVNGEEREAAFAGKGKVQAAYDAVVRTRRDPVLVQSLGEDRISVRCFPVQPNDEMKIRIGVTAPMQFEQGNEVWMRLPHFVERNFIVKSDIAHAVWFESKQPLQSSSPSLKPEHPADHLAENLFAVRGSLKHVELAKEFPAVRASRTAEITEAWTRNTRGAPDEVIHQRIEPKRAAALVRAVFVIDGSAGMNDVAEPIADALAKLPQSGEFAVLAASDEVVELEPMQPASSANLRDASSQVKQFKYAGGQDNLAALTRAWDMASEKPDGVIVWIHDPQPVQFAGADNLQQRWRRRPGGPRLVDLQTRKGVNAVGESLNGIAAVKTIVRMGDVSQELERMFARWGAGAGQFAVTREKLAAKDFKPQSNAKETSMHLARMWAFEEITRLMATEGGDEQATNLAATYQLVTPLTGAVVLETKEQYERAGLEPVKSGTVPTIPEPEEWLLMFVVATILAWMGFQNVRQRRRQWRAC